MIEGVVFDLEETLIRVYELHADAFMEISKKYGLEFKKGFKRKELLKMFGLPAEIIVREILSKKYSDADVKRFVKEKEEVFQTLIKSTQIKKLKGADELLEFLDENKIKANIASSASRRNVLTNLKKSNLHDKFKRFMSASDVKRGKPHPDTFVFAAKRIGLKPSECVAVGDSVFDIIAGRRAGMKTIGVATGSYSKKDLKDAGADYACKDLKEVKHIIERLIK